MGHTKHKSTVQRAEWAELPAADTGNLEKGKGWNHLAAQPLFSDGWGKASFAAPCLKSFFLQKDTQNLHYSLKIQINKSPKQKTKANKIAQTDETKVYWAYNTQYFYWENDHADEYRKLKHTFSAEGDSCTTVISLKFKTLTTGREVVMDFICTFEHLSLLYKLMYFKQPLEEG